MCIILGMKVIHNISAHKDLASHSEVAVHVSLLCWLGFQYLVTNISDVFNYIQFPSWIKKCTQQLPFIPAVVLVCFTALLSTITTFSLFLKHLSSHNSVIHCWYSPWPDFHLSGWRPPGVFYPFGSWCSYTTWTTSTIFVLLHILWQWTQMHLTP